MSRRLVLLTLVAVAVTVCGCGRLNQGIGSASTFPPSHYVERTTTTTPSQIGLTTEPAAEPVTADGRLLWNLEALLRATFGNSRPSSADNTDSGPTNSSNPSYPPANSTTGNYVNFNCAGDDCSPLAVYDPYWYTFQDPTGSSFRLSQQDYQKWSFGNYPAAVLINGKIVACDTNESTFLVRYFDASSFTLACIAPLSRS